MAVEDKYANSILEDATGLPQLLHCLSTGTPLIVMHETVEVAAADDNGSIYRMFKDVPSNFIPLLAVIANDAITAGSDYDLGLYDSAERGGAVVVKDCFLNGGDLSVAHASLCPGTALNALSAADIAAMNKKLWEYASDTIITRRPSFDIALTGNVVGTAAGTITVLLIGIKG
jgi:hypothetical protein